MHKLFRNILKVVFNFYNILPEMFLKLSSIFHKYFEIQSHIATKLHTHKKQQELQLKLVLLPQQTAIRLVSIYVNDL